MNLDDIQFYFLLEMLFCHLGEGKKNAVETKLTSEQRYQMTEQGLVEWSDEKIKLTSKGWAWLEHNLNMAITIDYSNTMPRVKLLESFIYHPINPISRETLSSKSDKLDV